MNINLSAAEIGVIVSALEHSFQSGSPELDIAQMLCDKVYEYLGEEFYDEWVSEFDISAF